MEPSLKSCLRALVLEIRHELEGSYDNAGGWKPGDLEKRLASVGVTRDRSVPADELAQVPPEDRGARRVIDAFIESRAEAKVGRADAVAEFLQDAAYTWANRLLALRCMEARGFIDEVVLQKENYGWRSLRHYRLSQKEPARCSGEDGGLFATLFDEFERRSKDLPMLFNPKAPAVALRPSVAVLKRCITLLSGTESPKGQNAATDELFTAPDALGWAYQYWNTEEKKRVDDWLNTKKGFKCEGRDIVPKTCLYTEDYMVKFLVQNSLGALWMQMHPESKLSERWDYYVRDADRVPSARKPVREITLIDPACGSGHFLIEAFDLLYAMYEEDGELKEPGEICAAILEHNLYGIDIDERTIQIAALALAMKAWERARDFTARRVNLVATNIALPSGSARLETFLRLHPGDAALKSALVAIFDGLAHADELGSLLQIEEPVEKELRYLREKHGAQTTIFGKDSGEDLATWKASVIERLRADFNADLAGADLSAAFFGEAGAKGLSLFDLLDRRYDVVVTNPPYMGSKNAGPVVKDYVGKHFSAGKRDLYGAFILRCRELAREGGRVAMVTQQSWMFNRQYADLRALSEAKRREMPRTFGGVVCETVIETLAHLGPRAFAEISGEVVSIALFVFSKAKLDARHRLVAFRVVGPPSSDEKNALLLRALAGGAPTVIFQPAQARFLTVALAPLCYWLRDRFFELLAEEAPLRRFVEISEGAGTRNEARFVRYFWECDYPSGRRWQLYAKGGGYRKWFGLNLWTVDWDHDGARARAYIAEKFPYLRGNVGILVREPELYGKPVLSYSDVAGGSLSVRHLERAICSDQGPGIYTKGLSRVRVSAILHCRLHSYILRALTPSPLHFRKGYLYLLPIPDALVSSEGASLEAKAEIAVNLKETIAAANLIEANFEATTFDRHSLKENWREASARACAQSSVLHAIEAELERAVFELYRLSNADLAAVLAETGMPTGWYPLIDGYQAHPSVSNTARPLPEFPKYAPEIFASSDQIGALRADLRTLYEQGPGGSIEIQEAEASTAEANEDDNGEEPAILGAHVPIPSETFLEELSQKLELHPISVYWMLRELLEKEGIVSLPELRRFIEDYFSAMVLRMLGHRWPRQIEAGDAVPDWAEKSGIIPMMPGTNGQPLIDRVRDRIAADFGSERVGAIEREFEEIMGKPLAGWLDSDFFKHHISQFRKRPIVWQLQSEPPSGSGASGKGKKGRKLTRRRAPLFSCLVYYHRLGDGLLETVRVAHIGPLRKSLQTEYSGLSGTKTRTSDQDARRAELEVQIEELSEFDQRLEASIEQGFMSPALEKIADEETIDKWTSRDGEAPPPATRDAFVAQERRYDPDVNDGVRVNIAPLQKAGLLAADVIATKDLGKAISDRAEWRADERRWCREGKLPRPGWWSQVEDADTAKGDNCAS